MSGDWIEKIRENAFVRIHHTNVLMWKIADGNRVLISKNASHGEAEGEKCSLCCTNFASPKKSELLRYLRQLFQRVFTIITDKSSMLQWWQMTSWGSKMVRQSDRTVCAKWFISEWSCDDLSDNHDFTIESSQSINAQFDAVIDSMNLTLEAAGRDASWDLWLLCELVDVRFSMLMSCHRLMMFVSKSVNL